ncbi:MAG: potassium transporter TrkH, partial [Desulfobulbaceae bacterium]|nr:potassium transporter TrkH [Desulfobulbaceae bacterium]
MKVITIKRSTIPGVGIEGALMTLSPLPFLFAGLGMKGDFPEVWRMAVALVAGLCCFGCGLTLFRNPRLGKILGGVGG